MDKSLKLYKKAVSHYSNGNVEKALVFCEKSISENIKNTSAINLKGLLLYFKGELEGAQALWKMNYQVNRDLVSKKYLEDTAEDSNRKLIYKASLIAIKELKLREAVRLLKKCRESDFNCINIHNSLALCYISLGEYNSALIHIEEVIKIDRKNITAIRNKENMIDLKVIKTQFNSKYIVLIVSGLALIIVVSMNFNTIRNQFVVKSRNKQEIINTPSAVAPLASVNKKDTIENSSTVIKKTFPIDIINKAINDKDYETLYSIVEEWKNSVLDINNKSMLQKAVNLLENSGIDYFYNNGRQAIKNRDYKTSEKYLVMAYNYGKSYYLYQDILYMLGYSYKNENTIDNCIKYYEEYDSKFPNGTYEETVLYDLSLIYKSLDIKISKDYAAKLVKQYPKSIYNNSVIKEILSS